MDNMDNQMVKRKFNGIIIAGSREIEDPKGVIADTLNKYIDNAELCIEGGCYGVDQIASKWIESKGFNHITEMAKWNQHGKAAGPIRNGEMIKKIKTKFVQMPITDNALFVFWSGYSKGSKDILKQCFEAGFTIYEFRIQMKEGKNENYVKIVKERIFDCSSANLDDE